MTIFCGVGTFHVTMCDWLLECIMSLKHQVFGFSLGTGWISARECVREAYNAICGFEKAGKPLINTK